MEQFWFCCTGFVVRMLWTRFNVRWKGYELALTTHCHPSSCDSCKIFCGIWKFFRNFTKCTVWDSLQQRWNFINGFVYFIDRTFRLSPKASDYHWMITFENPWIQSKQTRLVWLSKHTPGLSCWAICEVRIIWHKRTLQIVAEISNAEGVKSSKPHMMFSKSSMVCTLKT